MPEERSVLQEDSVAALLNKEYAISADRIRRLPLGTANCFHVSGAAGEWFLKEFPARFTGDGIEREAALTEFLHVAGFPCAQLHRTRKGSACFTYQEHRFLLQEWIDGTNYAGMPIPRRILSESAELLGQMHKILREYPLPREMDGAWVNSYSPNSTCQQYDRLIEAADSLTHDALAERIREDLLFKKELAHLVADYGKYYDGITYTSTHGDYSSIQWICRDGHIHAVVDFSSACILPAVWELMRSYIQSVFVTDDCFIDMDGVCEYVRHYMRYSPLREADLRAMPYVYLFQLSRSRYGYKEYLLTQTENRNELLRFAFRRTQICRQLIRLAPKLSDALLELL